MFGFVGPNGAGKTTAMRIILGVLAPNAGEVRWRGRPMNDEIRRRLGYLPEDHGQTFLDSSPPIASSRLIAVTGAAATFPAPAALLPSRAGLRWSYPWLSWSLPPERPTVCVQLSWLDMSRPASCTR